MDARETPSRPVAFINARLVDPATERDEPGGLIVKDGLIADLGANLRRTAPPDAEVVDCQGHVLCPGLIDMQVFSGEPGYEHRETLKTASRAAAAGGVTTMIVMPDTKPVIDQVSLVDFILRRARDNAIVNVHPMAAATRALEGREMTELGLLKRAGAVAFSNGKQSIMNARVMRNALLYARDFNALISHHTEDADLSGGAAMNAGLMATRLGLPSVASAAETMILERDLRLVELTNGRYHAATVTCARSVEAIAQAKARGLNVTCGISVNHLAFNENDIGAYRTFCKVRPPLRSEDDRMALVAAVADGMVDVIVSSHDPQDEDTKRLPFAEAADGAIGLETLLPGTLRSYHGGTVSLTTLLKTMTSTPADLLGLDGGRLKRGAPADLIVIDLGMPWMVDRYALRSRSKNSPFDEAKVQGRILRTMVAGETIYSHARETYH